MLLALPEDLSVVLLSDWLGDSLLALGRLDVAFCSRARASWLHVLGKVRIKGPDPTLAAKPLLNFLMWLHERDVYIDMLSVYLQADDCSDESWPSFSLRTLKLILPAKKACMVDEIQRFLTFFPSLESLDLDCSGLASPVLITSFRCPPPLRQLVLRKAWKIPQAQTLGVISSVSSSLEELVCDVVDDWLLLRLAECCSGLRSVDLGLQDRVQPSSLLALCSSNPQLFCVGLDGHMVTTNAVLDVLSVCPKLKEIELGPTSPVSFELLATISADNCAHKLDRISLCDIYISFHANHRRRWCDVIATETLWDGDLFFSSLRAPIRSIVFGENTRIDSMLLRLLADGHGATLEVAELYLDSLMQRLEVQYFLQRCSTLVELSLNGCFGEGNLITADDLRNLPLWCPRISKLQLTRCTKGLTNESVAVALERWSQNNITVLKLHGCGLSADAIMPVIRRCCPGLLHLSVVD